MLILTHVLVNNHSLTEDLEHRLVKCADDQKLWLKYNFVG